jgi:hypothetical protein
MSGLDQVMSRLKKSPASEPQPVPIKKKVIEEAPILDDEPSDEEEVEEDLEDEEDEEIEEPVEPIAPVKKIIPRVQVPVQPKVVQEVKEEPSIDELQRQRAEEVQLLQNNGIYRVEKLFQLGMLNKNLETIIKILKGE